MHVVGQGFARGHEEQATAHPEVEVQVRGERFQARAELLTDAEKDKVWDDIRRAIPQMNVYEKRTDRNIRVFRLRRIG